MPESDFNPARDFDLEAKDVQLEQRNKVIEALRVAHDLYDNYEGPETWLELTRMAYVKNKTKESV